jgi:toxin-antitoxin system PIN domain toxin
MSLSKVHQYLFDVNVFVALTARNHVHHQLVKEWFYASSSIKWAICSFTEAGFLRNATAPRAGQITMSEATAILMQLTRHPGYRYLPIDADWHTLCGPFFKRLYGTKQVTDAYLLGLAVRAGLTLVTLDKGIVHLAGNEYSKHVLLLEAADGLR